jgi:hypothetical protein
MRTSRPDANGQEPSGMPGPFYPMTVYTGRSSIPMRARNNGDDIDLTPRTLRRYVDASGVKSVQLHNGLRWGVASGRQMLYDGSFFYAFSPRIPGQSRGDSGGFHKRGPSPYQVSNQFQAGPGSQPEAPGGPGTLAGTQLFNPMSG